ncbi:hypothetical protein chiPu_0031289, partial [Chiloscyllium punctatum]|nr:hypothetical protein [Chiloscyllium punctatum]
RDRQTCHAALGIDLRDAGLVAWLGAGRGAGPLGEDHELPAELHLGRGALQRLDQRARPAAALDRDHADLLQVPAEHRDHHQLALEDEQRMLEEAHQRKRLPERLVLGGDDQRSRRNLLDAAELDPDVADHAHQEQAGVGPRRLDRHQRPARQQQRRQRDDAEQHQHQIEQHVEDQRAQEDHFSPCLTPARSPGGAAWLSARRDR